MKRIDRSRLRHQLRAGLKRRNRTIRPKGHEATLARKKKRRGKNKLYQAPIEAPAKLDIYSSKNHTAFVTFIEQFRRAALNKRRVFISFKSTYRITAAAGLLLVAETDRIIKAHPNLTIKCSFPPLRSEGRYRNAQNMVESALKQIGFFKLINQHSTKLTNQATVKRWRQLSGITTDGSLAASLLDTLEGVVSKSVQRKMYRGAIEAIANCVEHAYPQLRNDGLKIKDDRWWMLVGIDDEHISVIVCDLGVGIPETLPKKHPQSLLTSIASTFGIIDQSDGELIRASTYIKRTRTALSHRGKGGQDFRSIVDVFPSAQLSIRSNQGAFTLTGERCKRARKDRSRRFVDGTNHRESVSNFRDSIRGTLIEWVLSAEDFAK